MATLEDHRTRAFDFLTSDAPVGLEMASPASPTPRPFLHFVEEEAEEAAELIARLFELADSEDLGSVLDVVADVEHRELAKHALTVFITHHDKGRALQLPTYFERHPEALGAQAGAPPLLAADASGEQLLAWYREDAFQNEHHEHWHIVYPFQGIPTVTAGASSRIARASSSSPCTSKCWRATTPRGSRRVWSSLSL
ncbi:MAG: hypothetical protein KC431_31325 [Myxococcales bacterium]|nr:hypothetical protein [Myxococcales bacterium]